MEQYIFELVRLLGVGVKRFKDPGEARAVAAQQQTLYRTVAQSLATVPFLHSGSGGSTDAAPFAKKIAIDWAQNVLGSAAPEARREDRESDIWVVISPLPLLLDGPVHKLISTIQNPKDRSVADAGQMPTLYAAGLLAESSAMGTKAGWERIGAIDPIDAFALNSAGVRYLTAKHNDALAPAVLEGIHSQAATLNAAIETASKDFERERTQQRLDLDTISTRVIDVTAKAEDVASQLEKTEDRLKNFEQTIREELQLDRARETWAGRYRQARLGFFVSCGLLALFLVATAAIAVLAGPKIVASVNRFDLTLLLTGGAIGPALAHQLSKLIVLSVPIFVYLWILRAVMRFFMRSMLLMDDAKQRETMLDTYFLLSERGRADERDRPLILWALFRQTPGHGPDGIEPPDFTEVINAGMKRAGAPPAGQM